MSEDSGQKTDGQQAEELEKVKPASGGQEGGRELGWRAAGTCGATGAATAASEATATEEPAPSKTINEAGPTAAGSAAEDASATDDAEATDEEAAVGQPAFSAKTVIIALVVLVAVLGAAMAFYAASRAQDGSEPASAASRPEVDPSYVAAVVNGEEILESAVTDRVMVLRDSNEEYATDSGWAKALSDNGLTPQTLRENVIDTLKQELLVRQAAAEQDIVVDDAAVQEKIEEVKTSFGVQDEEQWQEVLTSYGYTEELLIEELNLSNLQDQLNDWLIANAKQEDIDQYISENAAQYLGKRVSAIILASGDGKSVDEIKAQAAELKARIDAGEDFATLADEYSMNATEEDTGGDVGWLNESSSLSDDLFAAYETLTVGAVAEPVFEETEATEDSEASVVAYILKCTEEFALPEDADSSAPIDVELVPESVKEALTEEYNSTLLSAYMTEKEEAAEVEINEMPEGLPYDVDMELASASSSAAVAEAEAAGLEITDEKVGDGDEAVAGSTVRVLYTGKLEDGTIFDSTANRDNEPFEFVLGDGQVIAGWDAGVVGMKVGGKRSLVIPAELGYGDSGTSTIPGGATLYFTIELLEVVPPEAAEATE